MIADFMPRRGDGPDQMRVTLGMAAQDEKGGLGLVLGQHL